MNTLAKLTALFDSVNLAAGSLVNANAGSETMRIVCALQLRGRRAVKAMLVWHGYYAVGRVKL